MSKSHPKLLDLLSCPYRILSSKGILKQLYICTEKYAMGIFQEQNTENNWFAEQINRNDTRAKKIENENKKIKMKT